jgi:hypothetical protein
VTENDKRLPMCYAALIQISFDAGMLHIDVKAVHGVIGSAVDKLASQLREAKQASSHSHSSLRTY